jgi:hypothetical protein
MKIEDLKFDYSDITESLNPKSIQSLVMHKLRKEGYEKSIELAKKKKITRQAFSQKVNSPKSKYDTIPFGGFLMVKEK